MLIVSAHFVYVFSVSASSPYLPYFILFKTKGPDDNSYRTQMIIFEMDPSLGFQSITESIYCQQNQDEKISIRYCNKKVPYFIFSYLKGTHTVYFSSSLYIISQKPMIPRTHFHCITT